MNYRITFALAEAQRGFGRPEVRSRQPYRLFRHANQAEKSGETDRLVTAFLDQSRLAAEPRGKNIDVHDPEPVRELSDQQNQ